MTEYETQVYMKKHFPVIVTEKQKNRSDLNYAEKLLREKRVPYIVGKLNELYLICRVLDHQDKKDLDFMEVLDRKLSKKGFHKLYPMNVLEFYYRKEGELLKLKLALNYEFKSIKL